MQASWVRGAVVVALVVAPGLGLAACSSTGPQGAAGFTSASGDCKSLRAEMNKLVASGVAGKVEALEAGRKLSPAAKAQVDRYNALLAGYLGQQCQNK